MGQNRMVASHQILVILGVFVLLYIVGMDHYLLEWLARRYFLLLWLPIIISLLIGKKKFGFTLLAGTLLGIPAGQLAENLKWVVYDSFQQSNSIVWGVPLYFLIVLISVIIGIILEHKTKKVRNT